MSLYVQLLWQRIFYTIQRKLLFLQLKVYKTEFLFENIYLLGLKKLFLVAVETIGHFLGNIL